MQVVITKYSQWVRPDGSLARYWPGKAVVKVSGEDYSRLMRLGAARVWVNPYRANAVVPTHV